MMTPDQEHQVKMLRALSALGTAYIDNTTHCPGCEMLTHTMLPTLGLARWIEGESIQDAMPELTPSQRESLLTGLCDRCYPHDDLEDMAARWVETEEILADPDTMEAIREAQAELCHIRTTPSVKPPLLTHGSMAIS